MKRVFFPGLLLPLLINGQPASWNEFNIQRILPQIATSGTKSLFHPELSMKSGSDPKLTLLLCTGNRYSMKEMSYVDAGVVWKMENGSIGYRGDFQGFSALNSSTQHVHYSQVISSGFMGGISIGIMNRKFTSQASDTRGFVQLKLSQTFGDKTSFGFGFGIAGDPIHKQNKTTKQWSCRWDQIINPQLSMGATVEKIDGYEPRIHLFMQAKIRQIFSMAGGWNLDDGNLELAGIHHQDNKGQGLIIRHHPLLGYGMELMLQYALR